MPNVSLRLSMQQQAQTQWCWAAVAASIAGFYNSRSAHSQCSTVCAVLPDSSCCANGASPRCNVPDSLERALKYVTHWASTLQGSPTWIRIDQELSAHHPVGVLVRLLGGSGHFVAISGTGAAKSQVLTVEDPFQGRTTTTLAQYAKSAHGVWAETYFTR